MPHLNVFLFYVAVLRKDDKYFYRNDGRKSITKESLYNIVAFYKEYLYYFYVFPLMSEKCMYVKMYITRYSVNGSLYRNQR